MRNNETNICPVQVGYCPTTPYHLGTHFCYLKFMTIGHDRSQEIGKIPCERQNNPP